MTTIDPESVVNLGILDPAYLRDMGEPPSSIRYLRERAGLPAEPSLAEVIGYACRPEPLEKL